MRKRLHYTYLLTHALPGGGCRYYVGIRTCPAGKTPETDTAYLGSGRAVRRAVRKHGRAAFSKTILEVFDTRDGAAALERALVGLATANSPHSYNLMEGGEEPGAGRHGREGRARIAASSKAMWEALSADERVARAEKLAAPLRTAEVRAQRSADRRAEWQRPEVRRARTEAQRRRFVQEGAEERAKRRAAVRKGKRRAMAERPAEHREAASRTGAFQRTYWAAMTPMERSAENKRRAAVARENKRRRQEVALIFLALVAAKYGNQGGQHQ